MPRPTPVAVSVVAELPKSLFARFDPPGLDPASTMYVVGLPDAAVQVRTTVPPLLDRSVRPPGAPGATQPPTTRVASLDAALVPAPFAARTRTKYVPVLTPPAENVVAVEPVLKFARLAAPAVESERDRTA